MINLPEKFSVFEVSLGISIINIVVLILALNNTLNLWIKLLIFVVILFISLSLIIHGLPNWIRDEKIDKDYREQKLKLITSDLKIKIDFIRAVWDLNWEYEDEHTPKEIDVTEYKIYVTVINNSQIPNLVNAFQVVSKKYGDLKFYSHSSTKVKERDESKFDIDATLSGKHAEKGDIITIKMKNIEGVDLEDSQEVNDFIYGKTYRDEHHMDEEF